MYCLVADLWLRMLGFSFASFSGKGFRADGSNYDKE